MPYIGRPNELITTLNVVQVRGGRGKPRGCGSIVGLTSDYDAERGDETKSLRLSGQLGRDSAGGGSERLQGSMPA